MAEGSGGGVCDGRIGVDGGAQYNEGAAGFEEKGKEEDGSGERKRRELQGETRGRAKCLHLSNISGPNQLFYLQL